LKFLLFGWLLKKQWQGHYRELARLVREDMARANAAYDTAGLRPSEMADNN